MKAKAWMLFVTFIDSILGFHHLCLWRPHCWPSAHLVRRRQRAFIHCCGIPPQVTSTNTFFHIWKPLTRYRINFFRIVGRLPIFLLAAAINLGVIVAMMVIVASQFFHSCWYHASWYQNCFALERSNLWQIFPGFDFLFLFLTNCLHLGRTLGFGWCNMANPSCFSILAKILPVNYGSHIFLSWSNIIPTNNIPRSMLYMGVYFLKRKR